jgi:hypothetical protein
MRRAPPPRVYGKAHGQSWAPARSPPTQSQRVALTPACPILRSQIVCELTRKHAERQLALVISPAGGRPQLPELRRPHSSQSSCCALHPRSLSPTASIDLDAPLDASARGHGSHARSVRRTARRSKPNTAQQLTLPLPALLLTHGSVPEGLICLGRPYAPGPTSTCVR